MICATDADIPGERAESSNPTVPDRCVSSGICVPSDVSAVNHVVTLNDDMLAHTGIFNSRIIPDRTGIAELGVPNVCVSVDTHTFPGFDVVDNCGLMVKNATHCHDLTYLLVSGTRSFTMSCFIASHRIPKPYHTHSCYLQLSFHRTSEVELSARFLLLCIDLHR